MSQEGNSDQNEAGGFDWRGSLTRRSRMRRVLAIKGNGELTVEEAEQGLLMRPSASGPVEIYRRSAHRRVCQRGEGAGEKAANRPVMDSNRMDPSAGRGEMISF